MGYFACRSKDWCALKALKLVTICNSRDESGIYCLPTKNCDDQAGEGKLFHHSKSQTIRRDYRAIHKYEDVGEMPLLIAGDNAPGSVVDKSFRLRPAA